ncbi:MAG: DegT/DnrJ/EryC1/StrS family aminotransferase [Candidatus Daviesbacteria bacterium]|nr:DegT/DnrJ/EryC1/StrS family aminotransferase [Candidatus Daviesbacteria bacterium]
MIKLVKSTFYKEKQTKERLINFIKKTNYLSLGAECLKFEKNLARYQGRKYSVYFNSGSSANLALIQSLLNLGLINKGDFAGFSALTWPTNVIPFIQLGLQPVPIDVELDTLNVSSRKLLDIFKKFPLKVFFVTNLLGFCDDLEEIREICKSRNIILIEDNCEGLGTVYRGEKLGNFSLASTFSFFVGHHISTIEGGAVCTDDEDLWVMLKLVRAHGWDRNLPKKYQDKIRKKAGVNSSFYAKYTFHELAYNLRPTEINAFLGNTQLKFVDKITKTRNKNFLKLAPIIYSKTDKYYSVKYDHIDFLSNFAVPLICKTVQIRDRLIKICRGKIEIRPIVGGDITQQPFFKKYSNDFVKLMDGSNAKLIHEQGLYFGNNPELTSKEIKEIIKIFTS